jgi:hypothetical protein
MKKATQRQPLNQVGRYIHIMTRFKKPPLAGAFQSTEAQILPQVHPHVQYTPTPAHRLRR